MDFDAIYYLFFGWRGGGRACHHDRGVGYIEPRLEEGVEVRNL